MTDVFALSKALCKQHMARTKKTWRL